MDKLREIVGRWLHDHIGWHVPLKDSIHVPWLGIWQYATCKYCGKEIMEASDFGDWILTGHDEPVLEGEQND